MEKKTAKQVKEIHRELEPFGYKMEVVDLVRILPISNDIKSDSKIPLHASYKDQETADRIRATASKAKLWRMRSKSYKNRKSYFGPHVDRLERGKQKWR